MKRVKNLGESIYGLFRHEVLGVFKNVLLVGGKTEFSEALVSKLDPSFNLFSIYGLKEKSYQQPLQFQSHFDGGDHGSYLQEVQKYFDSNKVKFDAAVFTDSLDDGFLFPGLGEESVLSDSVTKETLNNCLKNALGVNLCRKYL